MGLSRSFSCSAMGALIVGCLLLQVSNSNAQLRPDFYFGTCRQVFDIIGNVIVDELGSDPRIAASLLRLHFHDCFVNGCDASILLDNSTSFRTEKDAAPNANSARGFDVIDRMKDEIELACPRTVSCADILTIASQISVLLSGGPWWPVPLGRRDSLRAFFDLANTALPSPFFTLDQLKKSFADVGLNRPSDLVALSGGESHFLVTFSVEVTDGFLRTNLPSELINTTELKFKNIFRWQPIQTYASISKHVNVKASGIRFRGTIKQCNDLMEQLLHRGGENGAIMTLKMSDMGNYGCFLDCIERISLPLHVVARVNLIRKRPLSSLAAHVLGSVIVVESLVVFSLAIVLLFFTCKCAFLLVHERRSEHSVHMNPQKPTVDNAKLLNDNVSTRIVTRCFPESIWNRHAPNRQVGETSATQNKELPEINIVPFELEKG